MDERMDKRADRRTDARMDQGFSKIRENSLLALAVKSTHPTGDRLA